MRKIVAKCGIGSSGIEYQEEFEFKDNTADDEIETAVCEWAEQFLEVAWKEVTE